MHAADASLLPEYLRWALSALFHEPADRHVQHRQIFGSPYIPACVHVCVCVCVCVFARVCVFRQVCMYSCENVCVRARVCLQISLIPESCPGSLLLSTDAALLTLQRAPGTGERRIGLSMDHVQVRRGGRGGRGSSCVVILR